MNAAAPESVAAPAPRRRRPLGLGSGFLLGAGLTLFALWVGVPLGGAAAEAAPAWLGGLWQWGALNLGHAAWLFAAVLLMFVVNLTELRGELRELSPDPRRVAQLDQLSDVWIHLFVGIGVIWTAVGMRSALQAALGDPAGALGDSADNVLRKLVDGGILLALTTTIVGGIGGYLMRLGKTLTVGAPLQLLYDAVQRAELRELVRATERIEARLEPAA